MKRVFATILMLCMVFTLTACGGNGSGDTEKDSQNTQSEMNDNKDTQVDDGKVVYKVTVVDEGGNPVANTMVQVCNASTCFAPAATDESGVATFELEESDEYKAKLLPQTDDEYVYFESGSKELTLTVKAVQ